MQGTTLRQQGFHDVNKRRSFLQDNSWIKKRPEEEKDENYGRVVLNRHNSHDALDRKTNERDEPKATITRYRSDDTLDRQPGGLLSAHTTTTTTASASVATPVKKKRAKSLESLIHVNTGTDKDGKRSKDLNNLIKVNLRTGKIVEGREQGLDKLINVSPQAVKSTAGSKELDKLIKVNPEILMKNQRDQDLKNVIEVKSQVPENKNGRSDGQVNGLMDAPRNQPTRTTAYPYDARNNLRSVIERDMCTYCRKPLGVETKMILDELQICCHSTCFKVRRHVFYLT
ncbi:Sciellin [Tupaia chinensis]|uniref:Sciellin n=1 Tax=Tupaia chinensis TaxID=246437 RepID=L9LDK4_TUPCH|nr:Sciellin [Tupaia chinensis]